MKHNKDLGLFLLRLALALVFIAHGWAKLNGLGMTESFFSSVGIPAAGAMAVIVALVELLGGISMLVGLFTNYSGWLLFVVMGVAILQVKLAKGFVGGYEFELTLLLASLAVVFTGPGEWTIMKLIRKNS